MIPVTLSISGFLSYCEPVAVDFSAFKLACISGANGAGKSSLLDAMTWALFGQARHRDDALINAHSQTAEVILDFTYEGNLYRVRRSKPRSKTTVLEFYIQDGAGQWCPLTESSVRGTEQRIQHTLRMDYETFTNASFFLQGKADQFAQQRPGDRKRILSSILGLELWETYKERASERRKQRESELDRIDGILVEIEAELKEEAQRRHRLSLLEGELKKWSDQRQIKERDLESLRMIAATVEEQRRLVQLMASQLEAARLRLQQLTGDLEARGLDREGYQQQLLTAEKVEKAYHRWQDLRNGLAKWEETAAHFRQYEAQRSAPLFAIESERARLDQQRLTLMEVQSQALDLQNQLPAIQDQLRSLQGDVRTLAERMANLINLEADLRKLQDEQSTCQAENKQLRELMNELKERIEKLKETVGVACPLCGQDLSPVEREKLIIDLEGEGKTLGDRYRRNSDTILQNDQRRLDIENQIAELKKLDDKLRTCQRQADQISDREKQVDEILAVWQTEKEPLLRQVNALLESGFYAQDARAELARADEAMKELGYDSAAHDAARRAEQEAHQAEELFRRLENARAALGPLEREIAGLETQLAKEKKAVSGLETACQKAEEKFLSTAAGMPDLAQAESELFNVQEQENLLRMEVGGARQAVDVIKDQRKRQVEYQKQRDEIGRVIGQLKTLERAFSKDGIPALLIDQALPEIEAQANEILERLTAQGMTVNFATQKDYKDKSRDDKKETLDIIINDSAGPREYELFSGGEAFRVNFAIRLALSRVLAQRAGARLQTLVIDEGFGSQDADGRQRLIQAINLVQADFEKVLVITHLEELKDHFPARIEVEKNLKGSSVRVII
jgi:exonuclease SbcC